MDPSRLDNEALKFEITIRSMEYEEGKPGNNARKLRQILRQEIKGDSRRPTPNLDCAEEGIKISGYLNNLLEKTTLSSFKTGDKDFEDVYAQLCHAEGRLTYTDWTESEESMKMLDELKRKAASIRQQFFKDKRPYVVEKILPPPVEDDPEFSGFTTEQQAELDRISEELKLLKLQKERATQREISKLDDFETTKSEDDEADASERQQEAAEMAEIIKRRQEQQRQHQEQQRQQQELRQRQQQQENQNRILGQGSSSGVAEGPLPPNNPHPQNTPRNSNPSNPILPDPRSSAHNRFVNDSFLPQGEFNSTEIRHRRPASLPVHKWSMSFNGKADGEVIAFVKDVENMAISQGTSMEDLRRSISILLKGRAQDWYRVYGYQCGVWTDFVARLKEEFLPADFDHRVDEEIRRTKQFESETFQEFCVRMEMVFMKLSYEMMESMKVEHIKHNMHRSYKTPDVARLRTIRELREACRYVDSINVDRFKPTTQRYEKPTAFRPAPKVYALQETNEEYQDTIREQEEIPSSAESLAAADELQREIQAVQAYSRELRLQRPELNQVKCFNCNQMGHYSSSCPQPRRPIFCSGCRAQGVTRRSCRNCPPLNNATPNPSAPAEQGN